VTDLLCGEVAAGKDGEVVVPHLDIVIVAKFIVEKSLELRSINISARYDLSSVLLVGAWRRLGPATFAGRSSRSRLSAEAGEHEAKQRKR